MSHLFITCINLFISEKKVNIICHNTLKKYALRYKRQNKLLYKKISIIKTIIKCSRSCSVVSTYIRYTVGKCILNIPQIQEVGYTSKQGT